ncbi:MAG: DUF1579 domain-containing protein [Calditrichaeota bacterium]|nr:MAG: DUF1579 domain-containing protein [Calditrichota bacterium]
MRKKIALIALALILFGEIGRGWSQNTSQPRPCDSPEGNQFDFWLGEWQLTWPAEQFGGKPGTKAHGTNTVTKILDDCIIQEAFRFPAGNFNGHSISAYDARAKIWRQTWVDNRGGYLMFTGMFKDGKMELRTAPFERNGKTYISRMVFRNIKPNSLDWDWQRSLDGGKTWQDVWNIHYERSRK